MFDQLFATNLGDSGMTGTAQCSSHPHFNRSRQSHLLGPIHPQRRCCPWFPGLFFQSPIMPLRSWPYLHPPPSASYQHQFCMRILCHLFKRKPCIEKIHTRVWYVPSFIINSQGSILQFSSLSPYPVHIRIPKAGSNNAG